MKQVDFLALIRRKSSTLLKARGLSSRVFQQQQMVDWRRNMVELRIL